MMSLCRAERTSEGVGVTWTDWQQLSYLCMLSYLVNLAGRIWPVRSHTQVFNQGWKKT